MGIIIFDGVSSSDYGIRVEKQPNYEVPTRNCTASHVPGRNGDIILYSGSYDNVNRQYNCSFGSMNKDFHDFINGVTEWLYSSRGYRRLEDSYEPDYFRLARYDSNLSVENIFNHGGKFNLTFNCKPQKFLKTGEKKIDFSFSEKPKSIIFNPTKFDSLPIITIRPGGLARITVEPPGWEQNYTRYYTSEIDYIKSSNQREGYVLFKSDNEPGDWKDYRSTYFKKDPADEGGGKFIHVPEQTEWSDTVKYYKGNNVYLVELEEQPDDWDDNWSDYFKWYDDLNSARMMCMMYETEKPIFIPGKFYRAELDYQNIEQREQIPVIESGYFYSNGVAGTIVVRIGDYPIIINNFNNEITINSDIQDAYSGLQNRNSSVTLPNGFPVLKPGVNEISVDNEVITMEVIPKWWTL